MIASGSLIISLRFLLITVYSVNIVLMCVS